MKDLWQKRVTHYLQELGKYGRLIMNDHFSIILVIILAFGGLYYRELLVQLQAMDLAVVRLPILLGVTVWLMAAFQYGRPLWLTKDPDKSYLFPRGEAWSAYWLKGTLASMLLPAIFLALAVVMIMPFLELVTAWTLSMTWLLIGLVVLFKLASFMLLYLNIYGLGLGLGDGSGSVRWQHTVAFGVVLFVSLWLPGPWHLVVLGLVAVGLLAYIAWAMGQRDSRWMAFDYVVEEETLRESTLYKWIAVFADVPHLKPSVKRRAYLDRFLRGASVFNRDRYSYLFIRALFRNNAYSGVWLRVMVFIMVLVAMTESVWIVLGMGVVGHLLTIVQLIPVVQAYRTHPFQRIYPNRASSPVKAFQLAALLTLGLQSVAYLVVSLFTVGVGVELVVVAGAWLGLAVVLAYVYVPWWNQRQRKKARV